jgi:hypothetical protein
MMPDWDEVIEVDKVAELLKKSVSWCYLNAPDLGASQIGGSVIFRHAALAEALNRRMKSKEDGIKAKKTAEIVKSKRGRKPHYDPFDTNPSKYGIADLLSAPNFSGGSETGPEDPFSGIDIEKALKALGQR